MTLSSSWGFLAAALELAAVDLLLGGDNAILIALAARVLPPHERARAMAYAVCGAIALRFCFAAATGVLLRLPFVKLVGGVALLAIAIELLARASGKEEDEPGLEALAGAAKPYGFWRAVGLIIAADTIMSLDNVVALASIAEGDLPLLALGILLGIPALVFGAYFISYILERLPVLIYAGGALLGWIAGEMGASDPLWGGWIDERAPIMAFVAPGLCAGYAVIAGWVRGIYGVRPELGGALGKRLARRTGVFAQRARALYAQRAAAYALRRRLILAGVAALFIGIGVGALLHAINA
ncbi:MAG TPA: YjbE family putative metal transport protein [Roseiarcus sp.]|nr:YjbE family putative metal transport protein [Roseiarcus sp.]